MPTHASIAKSPLKMTKNHNVAISVGVFVGIGVHALILHSDGAQKVLSTPETILRHVEYLIFWFSMKFGEISNLTVFSYHFTHENSTFFNIVFDL